MAEAPTPTAAALRLDGVRKAFGRHLVLDGIDLTVAPGSVTAVLGPSGGGKTTLLRIVAGFEVPDAGTVAINGELVADARQTPARSVPPERRRVGVVPQEGALFPHLDVAGNVGFGLPRGESTRRRVAEVLDLVGLPGAERKRPHQLSGGQQHRIALARALAPRPSIVVLDEPFSSLDAGLRAQVRADVLHALRGSGATAIVVTHDQLEALSMADEVAVLLDGRIAQSAPPAALYDEPASLDVATFVGDAAVLRGRYDGSTVECALGRVAARPPASAPAGDTPADVELLLRPEQIAVRTHGATSPAPTGVVVTRSYFGHDAMVTVRLVDGTVVGARLQSSALPPLDATVELEVCSPGLVYPARPLS